MLVEGCHEHDPVACAYIIRSGTMTVNHSRGRCLRLLLTLLGCLSGCLPVDFPVSIFARVHASRVERLVYRKQDAGSQNGTMAPRSFDLSCLQHFTLNRQRSANYQTPSSDRGLVDSLTKSTWAVQHRSWSKGHLNNKRRPVFSRACRRETCPAFGSLPPAVNFSSAVVADILSAFCVQAPCFFPDR